MDWVQRMEGVLFAGIDYRHVILTVPEQLRSDLQASPWLLGEMIKAAVKTVK